MMNSERPRANSDDKWAPASASPNSFAKVDAIEEPAAKSEGEILCAFPITKVTAMVSPSARPRPNIMPPITPVLVYGNTIRQMTSQVVQPIP